MTSLLDSLRVQCSWKMMLLLRAISKTMKQSESNPNRSVKCSATTSTVERTSNAATSVGAKTSEIIISFLPLKGYIYFFVDFVDNEMTAKILKYGGKMAKTLNESNAVVVKEYGPGNEEACKAVAEQIKDMISKGDLQKQIAKYDEKDKHNDFHAVAVSAKEKSYVIRASWFNPIGTPNKCATDERIVVVVDDYDVAFCRDINIGPQTKVMRYQIVQDVDSKKFYVDLREADVWMLEDEENGSRLYSGQRTIWDTKGEAVDYFEENFKSKTGFVWSDRRSSQTRISFFE